MSTIEDFEKEYPLHFIGPGTNVVIEKLKVLPRTGWLQWDIDSPETVYEHIRLVRMMAVSYKESLGLSSDELQELLNMIEIHDWPEALVGDGVILGDEIDVKDLRAHKTARELEAMKIICDSLEDGELILALYERYTKGGDKIAKLTKQIEKLQAVFKAVEYENLYKKRGLTKEFLHYTKNLIHDPFLQSELKKAASRLVTTFIFINTLGSVTISLVLIYS